MPKYEDNFNYADGTWLKDTDNWSPPGDLLATAGQVDAGILYSGFFGSQLQTWGRATWHLPTPGLYQEAELYVYPDYWYPQHPTILTIFGGLILRQKDAAHYYAVTMSGTIQSPYVSPANYVQFRIYKVWGTNAGDWDIIGWTTCTLDPIQLPAGIFKATAYNDNGTVLRLEYNGYSFETKDTAFPYDGRYVGIFFFSTLKAEWWRVSWKSVRPVFITVDNFGNVYPTLRYEFGSGVPCSEDGEGRLVFEPNANAVNQGDGVLLVGRDTAQQSSSSSALSSSSSSSASSYSSSSASSYSSAQSSSSSSLSSQLSSSSSSLSSLSSDLSSSSSSLSSSSSSLSSISSSSLSSSSSSSLSSYSSDASSSSSSSASSYSSSASSYSSEQSSSSSALSSSSSSLASSSSASSYSSEQSSSSSALSSSSSALSSSSSDLSSSSSMLSSSSSSSLASESSSSESQASSSSMLSSSSSSIQSSLSSSSSSLMSSSSSMLSSSSSALSSSSSSLASSSSSSASQVSSSHSSVSSSRASSSSSSGALSSSSSALSSSSSSSLSSYSSEQSSSSSALSSSSSSMLSSSSSAQSSSSSSLSSSSSSSLSSYSSEQSSSSSSLCQSAQSSLSSASSSTGSDASSSYSSAVSSVSSYCPAGGGSDPCSFTDDFNRADEDPLAAPWTETICWNSAWGSKDTSPESWKLVSNQAQHYNRSASYGYAWIMVTQSLGAGCEDHYAQADFSGTGTYTYTGPVVRQSGGDFYAYKEGDLQKWIGTDASGGGSVTTLYNGSVALGTLKLQALGNELKCWDDGVLMATVTDSDLPSNLGVGFGDLQVADTDYSYTYVDNFEAGEAT